MACVVACIDDDYSPDVELNHEGRVVAARPIPRDAVIHVPRHMMRQLLTQRGPD